ncbi:MAG: folylpolyglutamate synthase/dihydrofolate synthase family protein [Pyrinomonadaceae bacterium]
MNYSDSVKYLLSLGNEVSAMKLGLDNVRKLLTALGDPQNNYIKVQVAGTNGKGSVCAFLDSICNSSGIKTGTFTSPHLVSMTERIRINGSDISEEDFARHATLVRETAENLLAKGALEYRPTFFEQITAIALVAFSESKVELAILETGLGGRLDATTATNAEIAAITRIDLDHQEYLGNTIEDIAAEKAAIIQAGSTVVIGEQDLEPKKVIDARLDRFGIVAGMAERVTTTCGSGWLKFATEKAEYEVTELGLKGQHQIENAKVVIRLVEILQGRFGITSENIIVGLANARHPGRLEYLGQYLFDGAHNIGGATALATYLREFEPRPITLVFGAMRGKDVQDIASILWPLAKSIVLTQPDNSRSMRAVELAKMAPLNVDRGRITLTESVGEALKKAEKLADANAIIMITGSLYLVGEAKGILKSQI